MKKKIKDLVKEDIPKCWSQLFKIHNALMVLFTEDEKRFNYAKSTIPQNLLEEEVELDE